MEGLSGGCLCQSVRYRVEEPLGPIIFCHCTQCQRASGTAFATNASVRENAFNVLEGRGFVVEYESSPGKTRAFCHCCGSPIYTRHVSRPGVVRVRLGTLDDDPGARPVAHIWVSSMPPWDEITDNLERFDKEPPPTYLAAEPRTGASEE